MNHQEYTKHLDFIEEQLNHGQPVKKILKMLDELYAYKPVSVRYHQIKCKVLMKRGLTEELIQEFEDKISKQYVLEGNIELWQQIIEIYFATNQIIEGKRQQYLLNRLIHNEEYLEEEKKLNQLKRRFIEGEEKKEVLKELEEQYLITCNRLLAYCVYFYQVLLYPETEQTEKMEFYRNIENMAYFAERLEEKVPVILVADKEKKEEYDILAHLLYAMHVPVYMIVDTVEIEGDYKWEDSVKISIDNQQVYEDGIAIWAIAKKKDVEAAESNIPYLIDYICKEQSKEDFCMVISSNKILETFRVHKSIAKRFERLSLYEAKQIEDEIGFGWAGDYYTYISKIYCHNVREWIDRETEYEFSIVVPVRGLSVTLEHTLRTCLEQSFSGSYEIVLSDNSVIGDNGVYSLYKRLNNEKIKYYKTPRDLNLTKSFEYAYLQTRGKYILSIGADDAVLPWGLQILSVLWKQYQDRDIILWDRGFYAYPGFNGKQQNELVIPCRYQQKKLEVNLNSRNGFFKAIKQNPQMMYNLPNLYINSGFQRTYIKKIYKKTGRLWDGRNQDIYTGMQNIAINQDILYFHYPLTIAGMSNSSIGALCIKVNEGINGKEKKHFQSIQGGKGIYSYIFMDTEMKVPNVTSDVAGLFCTINRLSMKGILSSKFYTDIEDMKKAIELFYNSIGILSDKLDKFVREGYAFLSLEKKDLQVWYQENILSIVEEHRYINIEKIKEQPLYQEGFTEAGGVILDASRYGVTNIYEAVQLFKSFLHF